MQKDMLLTQQGFVPTQKALQQKLRVITPTQKVMVVRQEIQATQKDI